MRILPKQLRKEEYHYYSDQSVEELRSEIQQLFDKTKQSNSYVNLTGVFVSEYEFQMVPKRQPVTIKNFERDMSYLNGQIFIDALKRTQITFSVRPNSIFAIFFFVFMVVGILALTLNNIKGEISEVKILGFVFTFLVPVMMLLFGYFTKKAIKSAFVKAFDLKSLKG